MNTTANRNPRTLLITSGLAAAIISVALVTGVATMVGWGKASNATEHTTQASAEPSDATPQDFNMVRGLSRAFQSVAKKAEPSVVHITQLRNVPLYTRDGFMGMPMFSGQTELRPSGLGSGNIVSPDGYILTNNHVVKGSEQLKVRLTDGREFPAKLVGRDEATDLAVIKIDAKNLTSIEFDDSDKLEVGEWVVALGSPLGLSNSVTAGIVSAKGRSGIAGLQDYQDFIQTDAAINPGNSGGALVNLDGKLVGVNSAIASRSGGYEGIGFAIPSNVAKSVMQSIISNGRVARGWLGLDFEDVSGTASSQRGARIAQVLDGGPAATSGLKPGDVVSEFNGRSIDDSARLRSLIALTPPGTKVDLGVLRDGK
jgi:serine protease Do